MEKNKNIVNLLDDLSKQAYGRKWSDSLRCFICGSEKVKPEDFKDSLSRKEFQISHTCQKCQDKIFQE